MRVPRVTAELEWSSLLTRRVRIRQLTVEGAVFDPTLLPADLPERQRDGDGGVTHFDIAELRIRGAGVGPVAVDGGVWLESWRIEEVEIDGSFVENRLVLRRIRGHAVAEHAARPAIHADLSSRGLELS